MLLRLRKNNERIEIKWREIESNAGHGITNKFIDVLLPCCLKIFFSDYL